MFYVDAASPNNPGTGTSEDPFRRIQDAIDFCVSGDTIEIRPGIYTGSGNYNLDPKSKNITISNTDPNDANIVANTIIDPAGAGRGFYIHNGEDANCRLSGLTIKNAYTGGKGAGIFCYNSSPTIENCVIADCSSETHGGGLSCQNSNSAIIGCVFNNNSSLNDGGGIEFWRSKPVLTNCIISNNFANGAGGGADYFDCDDVTMRNCTFVKNNAGSGGAVSSWDSSLTINSSILWANQAAQGSQVALKTTLSIIAVSYSNIEGGASEVYDPYSGLTWGAENMNTDPCFALFGPDSDPNLWDLHLKSTAGRWDPKAAPAVDLAQNGFVDLQDFAMLASLWCQEGENLDADLDYSGTVDLHDLRIMLNAYLTDQPLGMWVQDNVSSPCLDGGDPESGWLAEPWPNGKRINMGAFGGTIQASKNGFETDFDVSGYIDFVDFSYLAANWDIQQNCIEDLDGSGYVDVADLVKFCTLWLEQY